MKAFALVNATGKVNTGNGTFDVPAIGLSVTELKPNWVNVGDVAVVSEVLDYWAKLSKEDKSKQRKNTFVNTQASLITAGVVRGWRVK